MIAFILTMPKVNTWNGRWTGEGSVFARIHSTPRSKKSMEKYEPILGQRHYYDFGDGWCACIEVKSVERAEARRLRSASKGFWGYDWMIDSLLECGEIRVKERRS